MQLDYPRRTLDSVLSSRFSARCPTSFFLGKHDERACRTFGERAEKVSSSAWSLRQAIAYRDALDERRYERRYPYRTSRSSQLSSSCCPGEQPVRGGETFSKRDRPGSSLNATTDPARADDQQGSERSGRGQVRTNQLPLPMEIALEWSFPWSKISTRTLRLSMAPHFAAARRNKTHGREVSRIRPLGGGGAARRGGGLIARCIGARNFINKGAGMNASNLRPQLKLVRGEPRAPANTRPKFGANAALNTSGGEPLAGRLFRILAGNAAQAPQSRNGAKKNRISLPCSPAARKAVLTLWKGDESRGQPSSRGQRATGAAAAYERQRLREMTTKRGHIFPAYSRSFHRLLQLARGCSREREDGQPQPNGGR